MVFSRFAVRDVKILVAVIVEITPRPAMHVADIRGFGDSLLAGVEAAARSR
jgi:hypothetical protein